MRTHAAVDLVEALAFDVPTDRHESDGTFAWDKTAVVVAKVGAAGIVGIGWTYAHAAARELVLGPLRHAVVGLEATAIPMAWQRMGAAVRNIGRPGLSWEAISAVDVALWDLKGKLLGLSVVDLLGRARDGVAAYGSGGFTSYDDRELARQLGGWADAGFSAVKMKVGRRPDRDLERVRVAREAIGAGVGLFVDANGAYGRKEAVRFAETFSRYGVTWFEEPVSSEDLEGLALVRDRAPAPMEIAAGEYGYVPADFRRLVDARCLDVLQADATRCGGITGMIGVGDLAEAFGVPLSAHCAPHIHAHVGCAMRRLRHIEFFHDHARIDRLLFEGAVEARGGRLEPDRSKPGLGVTLRSDARRFEHR